MPQCSSCGASVRPLKKFCGVCGAALTATTPVPSRCRHCGLEATGTARFCRACGGAIDRFAVDAPSRERPAIGPVVWGAVVAGLAVCALAVGAYFMWPRTPESVTGPGENEVASLVALHLPSIVQLQGVTLQTLAPTASEGANGYRATFSASALITSSLYTEAGVENEFLLLKEAVAKGSVVPLAGAAFLTAAEGGGWTGDVAFEPNVLDTAKPREAFTGQPTMVEQSAEHLALQEAKANDAKDAQARAAAEADARRRLVEEQSARERAAEEARAAQARLAAQQQAQAAAAEAARIEAERQEHLKQQAEARQKEETARQEAESARRAQEARLGSGRVPKGREVTVRLQTAMRSDAVAVEDRFMVTTVDDVVIDGRVLVPAGATLRGAVAEVQSATRTKRTARLDLRFDLLSVGSRSFPVRGRAEIKGSGLKGDAKKIGIAAGIGAVVGGILGGAQGAAIGAGAGGGGTLAVTEGQEIDLPAGAQFKMKFDSPVDIP